MGVKKWVKKEVKNVVLYPIFGPPFDYKCLCKCLKKGSKKALKSAKNRPKRGPKPVKNGVQKCSKSGNSTSSDFTVVKNPVFDRFLDQKSVISMRHIHDFGLFF